GGTRIRHADPATHPDGLDGCLFQLFLETHGRISDEAYESGAKPTAGICGLEMNLATINISAILPAVILSVFGIAVMVAEPFVEDRKKSNLGWLAFVGTIAAIFSLTAMTGSRGQWYSNLWIVDDYSIFFTFLFLLIGAITTLSSLDFLRRE